MTTGAGGRDDSTDVELMCPACGGLIEAPDIDGLVALATEHCAVAHGYRIPSEHVISAAQAADS
jgi:hypothetical protein